MPVDPGLGERLASRVADLVAAAEVDLLRLLAELLREGIEADTWGQDALGRLQTLSTSLRSGARGLDQAVVAEIQQVVLEAYNLGQATAVSDLDDADIPPRPAPTPLATAAAIAATPTANMQRAIRQLPDLLTRTYTEAVAAGVQEVLGGQVTRLAASQHVLDRLASQGVTGFRDSAGRNWSLTSYAEMAVRTGAGQAAVQGHVDSLRASGLDLVVVSDAPRECPLCLVPGTVVEGPAPTGRTRSEYTGDVLSILTASGKNLTGTPDHPVLTPFGWRRLQHLRPGDQVLSDDGQQRYSGVVPDDVQVPARIEVAGEGVVPVLLAGPTRRDLDNDRAYREVRAVLPDGDLLSEWDATLVEPLRDLLLVGGIGAGAPFLGADDATSGLGALRDSPDCIMCRIEHGGALGGRRTLPPLAHRSSALGRQGLGVHRVERALQMAAAGSGGNSGAAQVVAHCPTADAESGAELARGLSGHVAADEIVSVSSRQFRGHVWDLSTGPSWFLANGIVTHNCRPFEGKVLSISGQVGEIVTQSVTDDRSVRVKVYDSVSGARAKGLNHPNCRHSLSAYLPGATRDTKPKSDPAGYEAGQRQRAMERHVRAWKRRQAVALDDAAARRAATKVRAWQKALRDHVDANDLKRLSSREQID